MASNPKLGDRIRAARERCGLGFIEAARRARIDKSLLSRLENGERENIRFDTAIRLSKALRISLPENARIYLNSLIHLGPRGFGKH
jgi:transcriptional regulator with XRE-family HTH domain